MIDFGFDRVRQIFAKLVAKNMRGSSVKSEILCVHQLGYAEKKVENNNFLGGPLPGADICQISL